MRLKTVLLVSALMGFATLAKGDGNLLSSVSSTFSKINSGLSGNWGTAAMGLATAGAAKYGFDEKKANELLQAKNKKADVMLQQFEEETKRVNAEIADLNVLRTVLQSQQGQMQNSHYSNDQRGYQAGGYGAVNGYGQMPPNGLGGPNYGGSMGGGHRSYHSHGGRHHGGSHSRSGSSDSSDSKSKKKSKKKGKKHH